MNSIQFVQQLPTDIALYILDNYCRYYKQEKTAVIRQISLIRINIEKSNQQADYYGVPPNHYPTVETILQAFRNKSNICQDCNTDIDFETGECGCSKIEEFDKIDMEAIVADGDEKEELRMKMGELVKQMADAGLKPRLFLGKGDVKGQARRYKKRVIDEKRFQCTKCDKVFACSSSHKHHIAKEVCGEKRCEICDRTF